MGKNQVRFFSRPPNQDEETDEIVCKQLGEVSQSQALLLMGDFDLTDACWKHRGNSLRGSWGVWKGTSRHSWSMSQLGTVPRWTCCLPTQKDSRAMQSDRPPVLGACSKQGHLEQAAQARSSQVLSLSKDRYSTVSLGNLFDYL